MEMPSVGEHRFICMSTEAKEPRWREGLIVDQQGEKYVMIARMMPGEKETAAFGTQLEVEDQALGLVAATAGQLRPSAPGGHLKLEMDPKKLFRRYYVMEEGDVSCGTASDVMDDSKDKKIKDLEMEVKAMKNMLAQALRTPGAVRGDEDADEEEEFEDAEDEMIPADLEDEPLAKLLRQQGGWGGPKKPTSGGGSGGASKPAGGGLTDLLGQVNARKSASSWEAPLLQGSAAASASRGADPLAALMRDPKQAGPQTVQNIINHELLKMLLKGKRGKSRGSGGQLSGSEDEDDKEVAKVGAAKSIHNYTQHGKDMFKEPRPHIRKYLEECMEEIGAEPGQPWALTDVTKRIGYGNNFRNIHRMDWMLRHILKYQLAGEAEAAALQTVLCLRCLRQVKHDDGSWRTAWMLTHLKDPIFPSRFAGSEQQLELIANYNKAIEELEKKTKRGQGGQDKKEVKEEA